MDKLDALERYGDKDFICYENKTTYADDEYPVAGLAELDAHVNLDALHLIKMWVLIVAMLLLSAVGCATTGYPKAFGNIRVSPWVLTPAQQDRKRTKQFIKQFNMAADYIRKGFER